MPSLRDRWNALWLRPMARRVPLLGVVAVVVLLIGSGGAAACSTPPSASPPYTVLTTIPLVDAIAANTSMVFAQGVQVCSQIWGISPSGTVGVYATVPVADSACTEGGLALAPNTTYVGSGGGSPPPDGVVIAEASPLWHTGHRACHGSPTNTTLFDVVAGRLFAITDGGSTVTQIATFPTSGKTSENMGLAYDQVGDFDHELIVTSSYGGEVWLVNPEGAVSLLVTLHTYIGGPAVAPVNFGSYGGDIIIAEKTRGHIVAVTPGGTVSVVADWSKANAVTFPTLSARHHHGGWVPQWSGNGGNGCGQGCTFGPDHDALFVANYSSGAVEAFPVSDLAHFYGQGFVAGGLNQGIAGFAADGTTTLFASQTERLSDIASMYCPTVTTTCGGSGCGEH